MCFDYFLLPLIMFVLSLTSSERACSIRDKLHPFHAVFSGKLCPSAALCLGVPNDHLQQDASLVTFSDPTRPELGPDSENIRFSV